jgi:hypothetical protein
MAGPITWQNVGQANFGDAAGFMQMSSQSANQAFSSAIKRTTEQEAKVKAGKTNALANQIYGITDPETLRAFQSKIDLEDPSIDSNVINDAVLKQGSILQSQKVDASNIARNEQDIAASKLRGDIDVATLGLNAADQAFQRNMKTEEANKAGVLFEQEKEKNATELENIRKDEYAKKLAGEAFAVYANGGDPKAVTAEAYRTTKDLTVLVKTQQYFDSAQAVSQTMNPLELEEVNRVKLSYQTQKDTLAKAGEAKKREVTEAYKDIPKDLVLAKQAMEKGGITTYEAVVTEFTDYLTKVDPDTGREFATQAGGKLTSSENEGAVGILKNASDPNSPMNAAYQLAIGERVEVPIYSPRTGQKVGTSLQLAEGRNKNNLSKVSPLQLKMALKALSPTGNFIDDGINVTLLGKEAAKFEGDITKLKEMDKELEVIDRKYIGDIEKLTSAETQAVDKMKAAKKMSMKSAVNRETNNNGERFPAFNPFDLENPENFIYQEQEDNRPEQRIE